MQGTRLRRILQLSTGLALCACGTDAGRESGSWEAAIDTVGDTVVVRTISGSVWGDTATLAPEVSIGVLDGADEYLLGSPRSIAVRSDGAMFVLDQQVPIIRMYAPDGAFVRDVGREGGGPGEYRLPGAIAVLPDDRLLVRDPGNRRVLVFTADGEYAGQLSFPGGYRTRRPIYVDGEGIAYTAVLLNHDVAVWNWEIGLVRIDPDIGILDTIPVPKWDYDPPQITATRENSSRSDRVPFAPTESWSFSPLGYLVGGLSTEYRIDLFRKGEPLLRIERHWSPVPVTRGEAEEQRQLAAHNMREEYPGWRWNGPNLPGAKPPFTELFVSCEGNIWVRTSQEGQSIMTEGESRAEEQRSGVPVLRFWEPTAYDVFTPKGEYLGHVRTPRSFRTRPEPIVRGDHVWAVTRDELDVARVVRFRLVRGKPQHQTGV